MYEYTIFTNLNDFIIKSKVKINENDLVNLNSRSYYVTMKTEDDALLVSEVKRSINVFQWKSNFMSWF